MCDKIRAMIAKSIGRYCSLLCLLFFGFCNISNPGVARFANIQELHAAMKAVKDRGEADAFWDHVLAHKAMPLIFDDHAVFFWRGSANTVEWRGDFNLWQSSAETQGKKLGDSNIWYCELTLPKDARLDYKLVFNGEDWQVDPLNPFQQVGGYGPNSEVRMPEWKAPTNVIPRANIKKGVLSQDNAFDSKKLGYSINYRVYTPANYNRSQRLPVLYVTDGSDYYRDEMGALVITLDNLIADQKIQPLIAVFIDPWDRKANVNKREEQLIPHTDRSSPFSEFIVEELLPTVEKQYNTLQGRESRGIVGTSLGGGHAIYMATRYASYFGLIGVQSPAIRGIPWLLEETAKAKPPVKAFIEAGTIEGDFVLSARAIRDTWAKQNVNIRYIEVNEGHSWGHWRALLDDMLEFFYPPDKKGIS